MKMISIVVGGDGAFYTAVSQNPELYRRQISEEAGSAHVVFAMAPMLGHSASLALEKIEQHILPRFAATSRLQHDFIFQSQVCWIAIGRPLLHAYIGNAMSRLSHMCGISLARSTRRRFSQFNRRVA